MTPEAGSGGGLVIDGSVEAFRDEGQRRMCGSQRRPRSRAIMHIPENVVFLKKKPKDVSQVNTYTFRTLERVVEVKVLDFRGHTFGTQGRRR